MKRPMSNFIVASALVAVASCIHVRDEVDQLRGPDDDVRPADPGVLDFVVVREGFSCLDAYAASKNAVTDKVAAMNVFSSRPSDATNVLTAIGQQELYAMAGSDSIKKYKDVGFVFTAETASAIETAAILFPKAIILPLPMLSNSTVKDKQRLLNDEQVALRLRDIKLGLPNFGDKLRELRVNSLWENKVSTSKFGTNSWLGFLEFLGQVYIPSLQPKWLEDEAELTAWIDQNFKQVAVVTTGSIMEDSHFNGCKESAARDSQFHVKAVSWKPQAQSVVSVQYKIRPDNVGQGMKRRNVEQFGGMFAKAKQAVGDRLNNILGRSLQEKTSWDKTPMYVLELNIQDKAKEHKYDRDADLKPTCWVFTDGFTLGDEPVCNADFKCRGGKPQTVEEKHAAAGQTLLNAAETIMGSQAAIKELDVQMSTAKDYSELQGKKATAAWLGRRALGMVYSGAAAKTKDYYEREKQRQIKAIANAKTVFEKSKADLAKFEAETCRVEGVKPFHGAPWNGEVKVYPTTPEEIQMGAPLPQAAEAIEKKTETSQQEQQQQQQQQQAQQEEPQPEPQQLQPEQPPEPELQPEQPQPEPSQDLQPEPLAYATPESTKVDVPEALRDM